MLIEAGFFTLLALAIRKGLKKSKIDPESETIFLEALANLHGPEAPKMFRKLAEAAARDGYPIHAKILRTRATYLEAGPEEKAERDAVIGRAMKSTKPEAIEEVAAWFEGQTATGIARDLRKHAQEVRNGTYKPSVENVAKTNGHVKAAEPKAAN